MFYLNISIKKKGVSCIKVIALCLNLNFLSEIFSYCLCRLNQADANASVTHVALLVDQMQLGVT